MLTLSPLMDTLVAGGEGGGAAQGHPSIDDWQGAVTYNLFLKNKIWKKLLPVLKNKWIGKRYLLCQK